MPRCPAVVTSTPAQLAREVGGAIAILYCYAVIVVVATLGLYIKYYLLISIQSRKTYDVDV